MQLYFFSVKMQTKTLITSKQPSMSDQQNTPQSNMPVDDEELVKDEEEVHDQWMKNKISEKAVEEIDTIPELEQEAEKIKLEEGMATLSAPDTTQALEEAPPQVELPPQEEKKDETPASIQAPSSPEIQEVKQEVLTEIKQELANEAPIEVKSEISKPQL